MKKLLFSTLLAIGLCLLTKSCFKEGDLDFSNLTVSSNFVYDLPLPLVDTRLTLDRLLKNIDTNNQYVLPDPATGLLRLIYNMPFSFDFDSLKIKIPDQRPSIPPLPSIPILRDIIIQIPVLGNDTIRLDPSYSFSGGIAMNLNMGGNYRIDTLITESMRFQFIINTTISNRIDIDLTTTNMRNAAGDPLVIPIRIPWRNSTTTYRDTISMDLSDYRIIPDNSDPDTLHRIQFSYSAAIFKDTTRFHTLSPIPPPTLADIPTGLVNLSASFANIEIDRAFGYFGVQNFEIRASGLDIHIFEKFPLEILSLDTADMKLTITNGLGIPVSMDARIATLTRNKSGQSGTPQVLEFENRRLTSPQNPFDDPTDTTFQEGIQHLVDVNAGFMPYRVEYSAKITTNPDADPTTRNFVSKRSFINVDIGAEIPMRLRVGGLQLSDTIAF
ncbi:MAG: hypothetical protein LBP96_02660, partial [Bacteroidales bacterium]|nr:hypothetical protein [Bacteroidales bacterium]